MKNERGFTIVEILIVVAVIAIISAIAIPRMVRARKAAKEAAAIGTIRSILSVESAYLPVYGGYAKYADAAELINKKLVTAELFTGLTNGYGFDMKLGGTGTSFELTATPDPAEADSKYYYTDQTGVIRVNVGAPADASSDLIPDFK